MYTTATLMIAFSTAATSVLMFPAASLLAVGGGTFYITNMQVGNLFGNRRSTVITLYNGAFASSSSAFLLVKVLYEAGFSIKSIFLFISSLSIVHILRTFFLLPRKHIPFPLPKGYTYGVTCSKPGLGASYRTKEQPGKQVKALREGEAESTLERGMEKKRWKWVVRDDMSSLDSLNPQLPTGSEGNEEKVQSFRSCILSKLFLTHLLWISILQLRHYLFIGTLNPMLTMLAKGDTTQVSRFTNAYALTQICGVFCAPWNGIIMDWLQGRDKIPDTAPDSAALKRLSGMKAVVLSLIITITQCVLFSISASVPILEVQYLSFILQVINHSFLYGGDAAFISIVYPTCHFGKIYGVGQTLSAFISLLQYPCFALVQGPLQHNPLYVNIGFIILVILTYVHPVNLYLHWRREVQERSTAKSAQIKVPNMLERPSPLARDSEI
ncbi:equilibrative nucleobase transporter 1-like [Mustelus asterias]